MLRNIILTCDLGRGLAGGCRGNYAAFPFTAFKRFDRLAALGINPGTVLNLHQRTPAFLVRLGETEPRRWRGNLALDPEIADKIYIRPID